MDTNKKNKSILDRLDNVELELLQNDTEYAKQFLKDEGIDPTEELMFVGKYMKKIQFMSLAISSKKQDLKLLEVAFSQIKAAIIENAQKTSDVLISMLHSKAPSFQYRKLENWSDEEIREVLIDIDLVQLMEELKKEK